MNNVVGKLANAIKVALIFTVIAIIGLMIFNSQQIGDWAFWMQYSYFIGGVGALSFSAALVHTWIRGPDQCDRVYPEVGPEAKSSPDIVDLAEQTPEGI